jgi:gas vesicle protein
MSSNRVLTGLFAFAGGFLSGILFAPQSGADTREQLADEARSQLHGVDERLKNLEAQISSLGDQLLTASSQWSEKVKQAAADTVLPDVPDDPDAFKLDGGQVAADLRHLPRK